MNHSRWHLLPPVPGSLLSGSDFSPLMVQLFYNRGLAEPSHREAFLAADERLAGDPFLLPGMPPAVGRIYQALLGGEKMAVYGDFDVDGITATALLVQGITTLGGVVIPYIPHRLTEGYGLNNAALEKLAADDVRLVITVDCGITALAEVRRARRLGLEVVITDHHVPLAETPPAVAIVNPRLEGSAYPFAGLAGVGVALKLVQALFLGMGRQPPLDELADLVALGTVADMMPLVGENRYLVKQGLMRINQAPRLGVGELIARAGLSTGGIDAERISWVLAPRLNAAGRLEHAMTSYQLLVAQSPPEAQRLAEWLEQKNAERQQLTASCLAKARGQVLAEGISPLLVAGDREYPAGIVGLVAGRLTDEFYRPAVVVRIGEKVSSGSCRSIPEFDITRALEQHRHLLSRFGGHPQAAGFVLPTGNLAGLLQGLLRLASAQLEGVDLRPRIDIDAEVSLGDIGGETYRETQQLAPFGCGNPLPVFLSRRIEVLDLRPMGAGGEHLRLKLRQGGVVWDGVGFRCGSYLAEVSSPLDIVYNLEMDRWGGEKRLRLNILDFAPAR